MKYCEFLLLVILAALLSISSYTDCKRGIIPNKLLLVCSVAAVVIDAIYYTSWCSGFFRGFLSNLLSITAVSILLYCCHVWAAGDSKLLMVVSLCIPGRFFTFWDIGSCQGFTIVMVAFVASLLYALLDTFVLDLKGGSVSISAIQSFAISRGIAAYLFSMGAVLIARSALVAVVPTLYLENILSFFAVDFSIVLLLARLRERLSTMRLLISGAILLVLCGVLSPLLSLSVSLPSLIRSLLFVLLAMVGTVFAGRYNYMAVPTSSIRAGQILSASTIVEFASSRVRGLPTRTTEDMRSRITEDEAESVLRWERSSLGRPVVTIVRKMPFAIFIAIGTVALLLVEAVMRWH